MQMRKNEEWGIISWVSQNRMNPNQQWMHLMNKIDKKINLEDFGDASII